MPKVLMGTSAQLQTSSKGTWLQNAEFLHHAYV